MIVSAEEVNGRVSAPNVARALAGLDVVRSPVRVWDGVEAMRFRPDSAEIFVPALSNHVVVVHLGGSIRMARRADDGRMREGFVRRGGSAVVPAGSTSEWRWGEHGEGGADSLHLYLTPALIREAARDAGLDPDEVEILGGPGSQEPQIERIGMSFLPELEARNLPGSTLYAEALAQALAVHLLRAHSSLGRSGKRAAYGEPEGGLSKRALRRATDYVGDNLAGDLALKDIARAANASPYHFLRLFKKSTGLSPHQYVIERRVGKARELLTTTDLPLHEVAATAGFADQSHMGRHTKRLLGVSPARLRRG